MADSVLPLPSAPADWRDALLALPVEAPPTTAWSAIASRLPPSAAAPARRRRPVRGWAIAATLGAAVAGLLALRSLPVDPAVEASTVATRGAAVPRLSDVATASLDAVDPEPLPAGHWMYSDPRVRLSPHISWNMPGAAEILIDAFIDNVRRWRRGEPLDGLVDHAAGY